jgi:hypothetical protein
MKALITAALILTTTFATADNRPDWVKKLSAEAKAEKAKSGGDDDFKYDRYDPDKMELVASIEGRLTIHQEADGIEFTHFKAGECLLIKKGHIALLVHAYLEKLNVINVYEMDPDANYQPVGERIYINIPAKDVQKYAVEFFVNGLESFIERYSIVVPGTNKSQAHNVDRKPLELKLKTIEEEQAEWESEEGE